MYRFMVAENTYMLKNDLEFINENHYEIVCITQEDGKYTIFYKDNKNIW